MQRHSLILVGIGPRGLGVLERLNTVYHHENPAWGMDVHLVDPGAPGEGCHPDDQPDYLLTNTVAAQITMFSDPTVQSAGPVSKGPSLHEWANQAGYRNVDGRFVKTPSDGRVVDENDYLPRSFLGGYLSFVFDHIVANLHPSIKFHHYRSSARSINFLADKRVVVELERGFSILADFAVLTTGHGKNRPTGDDEKWLTSVARGAARNPYLAYVSHAYPLNGIQSISHDAVVGIQGMGLTAYDVIACLTQGRGGRFEKTSERGLNYRPSGREPKIVVFSRQGLPFSSRAVNQKGVSGQAQPKFFTRAWIDELRHASVRQGLNGKLDFERDLWPVLLKEMCFAYHAAKTGAIPMFPAGYEPDPKDLAEIRRMIHPLEGRRFNDAAEYESEVRAYLEDDLNEAFGGNVSSPIKAATDMLRDVRDNIRYAVDFGGLTPQSHAHFLSEFCPLMNRIAVGPPKERNMQLLALLDAGIVTLAPGPAPVLGFNPTEARFLVMSTQLEQPTTHYFDVLVRAKLDAFYPEQDSSPFIANALANKVIRPYRNGSFHPGGIEVDRAQNVVDAEGRTRTNVWALGNLAEGANFYTYVLPRPMVNSRFIQDAGKCVIDMLRLAEAKGKRQLRPAAKQLSA